MSKATVYSTSQFGMTTEVSATGIIAGTCSWEGTSTSVELVDHVGNTSGLAIHDPKKAVKISGVISTKTTGLVGNIGTVLTLSNSTFNSRTRNSEGTGTTPVGGAAVIITGNSISTSQNGFETGGIDGMYFPYLATGTTYDAT